jgi:glutaredoxin
MPQVTIFTNHGCSACQAAKQFFNEHGVAYVERNIGDDPEARDELIRRGFRAVPVIRIGGEAMVGFSAMKLRRMLGL